MLDTDHPLVARLVGQPRRADDIADRIDPRLAGAQPLVDHDVGPVDDHTGVFEADIFDIADDADGQDHALDIRFERFAVRLDPCRDPLASAVQGRHGRRGVDFDPLFLKRLAGEGRDLLVLDRQHAVEHFDDRHLGAHVVIKAGEFDPDRA